MSIEKFFWVVSEFLVLNLFAYILGMTIGRKRRIGFFWTYILTVFVNPVIGIIALASPKKGDYPKPKPIEKLLGVLISASCAIASIVFLGQSLSLLNQSGVSLEMLGRLYGTIGFGLSSFYWFGRYRRNERLREASIEQIIVA